MKYKCSKIYLLLFGLVCSFTFSLINPNTTSAYQFIKPFNLSQNTINYLSSEFTGCRTTLEPTDDFDIQFVIWTDNYYTVDDDNNRPRLLAYTCDYRDSYGNKQTLADCGTYRVLVGGRYRYAIVASYFISANVSPSTGDLVYNGNEYATSWSINYDGNYAGWYYDEKFPNASNLDNFGLYTDSLNKLDDWNIGQPDDNTDDSSIIDSIINAITSFFKPLFDSINAFLESISTTASNTLDSVTSFFDNFFNDLSDNVNSWFILDEDLLVTQFDNFKSSFNSKFSFVSAVVAFPVSIYSIMLNNLSYIPPCNAFRLNANVAESWAINMCSVSPSLLLIARSFLSIILVFAIFKLLENIVYTIIDAEDKKGDNS